ncbi:DUF1697 domain-containing protein [Snuella sp. CAU 1569]|uniref:DUF1697 domain-containing protein n=1 Tax=Snuella sedimenti TaxID=2798802 RepID=A0A8J7LPV6_9FLAO|nr:DUF1697 domain-containing protein [Snuella sedimenti]
MVFFYDKSKIRDSQAFLKLKLSDSCGLQTIIDQCPFAKDEAQNSYFTLLHDIPKKELIKATSEENYTDETFIIKNRCVYFYSKNGYGRAKCNNNFFERKLKVVATTRNFKTMVKLLSLSVEN